MAPDPVTTEQQVAEHKAKLQQFETYLGIENALQNEIKEAVDADNANAYSPLKQRCWIG